MDYAHNGSTEIAYETFGDGEPVLLIMGIGSQMVIWPEGFCAELACSGFAVTRFDNRDTGLSTHFPEDAEYRLEDMADDVVAILDARGEASAHVVGLSMGGAIAQVLATRHPDRVRTLTSMMSWSDLSTSRPDPAVFVELAKEFPDTEEGWPDRMAHITRVLGSTGYPVDEQWVREVARVSWSRAHDPGTLVRHDRAVKATGDLRPRAAGIRVPTLVLHGEADPLCTIEAGRETAAIIPGARLVTYPGLGHDLPRELWSAFADEIAAVAGKA
jgi:pimeloyl-ACP methyl ester carboxylesterase